MPRRLNQNRQLFGAPPVGGVVSNSTPAGSVLTGPCSAAHSLSGRGATQAEPVTPGDGQGGGEAGGFVLGRSSMTHWYEFGPHTTNATPMLTLRPMALSRAAWISPATCCVAPWI